MKLRLACGMVLMLASLLTACGGGGGGPAASGGTKYYVTGVDGAGFNNDTIVINRKSLRDCTLTSSDGRFNNTPINVTSASEEVIEGTAEVGSGRAALKATVRIRFGSGKSVTIKITINDAIAEGSGSASNPWNGTWKGAYTGEGAGTWTATITNGVMKVTAQMYDSTLSGSGTASDTGANLSMSASGSLAGAGAKVSFAGKLYFADDVGHASGTWSSIVDGKPYRGTWSGQKE